MYLFIFKYMYSKLHWANRVGLEVSVSDRYCWLVFLPKLYNILYTVSTQQHQYSDIMYAVGYSMATCSYHHQANKEHFV